MLTMLNITSLELEIDIDNPKFIKQESNNKQANSNIIDNNLKYFFPKIFAQTIIKIENKSTLEYLLIIEK